MFQHLSDYVRQDKIAFERMFVPDHVDHITIEGKIYGWPIVISADALAYNKDLFDARGLAHPPVNTGDTTWTMEKFLDVAQKLTRNDGQVFGFGGTRSGYDRFTDGTNWGQAPWDGARSSFDGPLWQQAEQFWLDCIHKWHVQPTAAERPSIAPPSGPFFFNAKTGMDVVFAAPPANVWFKLGRSRRCRTPGRGRTSPGRLGLHSLHMAAGWKNKDAVWQVLKWFRNKEHRRAPSR